MTDHADVRPSARVYAQEECDNAARRESLRISFRVALLLTAVALLPTDWDAAFELKPEDETPKKLKEVLLKEVDERKKRWQELSNRNNNHVPVDTR